MDPNSSPVDEYTLAAYIAGTLPRDRRDEVAAHLAQNAEARELLRMAYDALEVARQAEAALPLGASAPPVESFPTPTRTPETPKKPARIHVLARYAVAATVLIAVGWGARAAMDSDVDTYRNEPAEAAPALTVAVLPSGAGFTWNAVPGAYRYRVVIWDREAAEVAGRFETHETNLRPGDPSYNDVQAGLEQGRPYTIRVDAVDGQNRVIVSSDATTFVKE